MKTANGPFLVSAAPANRVRQGTQGRAHRAALGSFGFYLLNTSFRAIGTTEFVLIAISEQGLLRDAPLGGPHQWLNVLVFLVGSNSPFDPHKTQEPPR